MTSIKYLSLTKGQRFIVNVGSFFKGIGRGFVNFFKGIPFKFIKLGHKLIKPFEVLVDAWKKGTWMVRGNFLVFGLYQLFHNQIMRGILYLLYEVVFIWFMITTGGPYLAKLGSLGTFSPTSMYLADVYEGLTVTLPGDRSFTILLYSIVTFILMGIFVALWYFSIRDARSLQNSYAVGKYEKNGQFFKDILDKKYHTLLLAVPLVGLVGFTVIPVIFMIITGFTNYSGTQFYLFDWVGFDNYLTLFLNDDNTVSLRDFSKNLFKEVTVDSKYAKVSSAVEVLEANLKEALRTSGKTLPAAKKQKLEKLLENILNLSGKYLDYVLELLHLFYLDSLFLML